MVVGAAALLAARPPGIHFFLVGYGPEKEKLVDRAQQLSVVNVTFVAPVPKSRVPTLLRQADLLLQC